MAFSVAKSSIDEDLRSEIRMGLSVQRAVMLRVETDGQLRVWLGGDLVAPMTVVPVSMPPSRSADKLQQMLKGHREDGKIVYPSSAGDFMLFQNCVFAGGKLWVDGFAGRFDCSTKGDAQIVRALARPSRTTVSEGGVVQYVTLADPAKAVLAKTNEDLRTIIDGLYADTTVMGRPGLLFRSAGKDEEIWADETRNGFETAGQFANRLIKVNDLMGGLAGQHITSMSTKAQGVEILPIFSVPMSSSHVYREGIDPKQKQSGVVGKFTDHYVASGTRGPGFRPSIMMLSEEAVFRFGGNTGETRRVVSGMVPVQDPIFNSKTMPTAHRFEPGSKVVAMKGFWSGDEVKSRMTARQEHLREFTGKPVRSAAPAEPAKASSQQVHRSTSTSSFGPRGIPTQSFGTGMKIGR